MTASDTVLKLHAADNVAIALCDLAAGDAVAGGGVVARGDIPRGHKVAVFDIGAGQPVTKLGQPIGVANAVISAGDHVHVHNITADPASTGPLPEEYRAVWETTDTTSGFMGYRRDDGRCGTRNYIGIISTVNCSATVVRKVIEQFSDSEIAEFRNVDGIVPVTHTSGCGMAADSAGLTLLQRTLRGFITHPNFGGVLVIGLGCEVNDAAQLLASEPPIASCAGLRVMTIQAEGGTRQAVEAGAAHVRELLHYANSAVRESLPASCLTLGLQCGASDSYSAITANPALGVAADCLVRAGGTVLLAETPEIHGAEHLLYRRAASFAAVQKLQERLKWWQQYVAMNGASLNNNPSPGNIAGGISTILEKSLGAVAKSGSSPLRDVIDYGERVRGPGFVFMDSPGYDPCSVTGEIASGANVICFTTGRGSVFGAKPSPSIKIATHTELATRMAEDMDFNSGPVLDGGMSLEEAGEQIFSLILDVASGRRSASELSGFGDLEFVPWQLGAVL